ncbi:DUF2818 family protein [Neisseria subflava]|uniref:DUF2818 family protein n=1 Tax=Neisseria subflava TaxID=28449 RepID=UPI003D80A54A
MTHPCTFFCCWHSSCQRTIYYTKFFGIIALKRKHIGHHLIELLAGFLLTAILAISSIACRSRTCQDWEFYATVVCLYLILPSMLCMALLLE